LLKINSRRNLPGNTTSEKEFQEKKIRNIVLKGTTVGENHLSGTQMLKRIKRIPVEENNLSGHSRLK
jgi:hypothetical protein